MSTAVGIRALKVNPYAADFFQTIFHPFEAGIAKAFSSPNDKKKIKFMNKYTS